MTRRIVVANQKGGVGKTTTVANLGAALQQAGQRVLLVDLDPQAALTATFGLDPYTLDRTMYSVLMNPNITLMSVLKSVGVEGKIALAPASFDLSAAEIQLAKMKGRAHRLRYILDHAPLPFDFVLIDTPPSLNLLTMNGFVAATEVLIPVQCQYLAMRGIRPLLKTVERVQTKLNPDLKLLGLLPTMYADESRHADQVIAELKRVFGGKVFDTPVQHSLTFAEVPVANRTLVEYDPQHAGAQAYRTLAEALIR